MRQIMLLKNKQTGVLVKIDGTETLIDPSKSSITGRIQAGEEEQEPEEFSKEMLIFPSDEALPRCWMDPEYKAQL